jgi:PAS domain S-box-containing protein
VKKKQKKPDAGAFFEHAQMGMAILSLDDPNDPTSLRVVDFNEAAGQIGAVPKDIIGLTARDIPQAAQLEVLKDVARVITEQRAVDLGDIPGVFLPDRTFMAKLFPIPPNCCGLIFEDVTEQRSSERALRESEERFRKTFDASPVGICLFNVSTRELIDVNPRFVELLGYGSAAALIGKNLDVLGMWAGEDEYDNIVAQLRSSRSLRETTVIYRTYGGQVRRAIVALELIEIDGQECALGLFWRA